MYAAPGAPPAALALGGEACGIFGALARWADADYDRRIAPLQEAWSLLEKSARERSRELRAIAQSDPRAARAGTLVHTQAVLTRALREAQAFLPSAEEVPARAE